MSYLLSKGLTLSSYTTKIKTVLDWLEENVGPKKEYTNRTQMIDGFQDEWDRLCASMQLFTDQRCTFSPLAIIHVVGEGWEMYQTWFRDPGQVNIQIFVRVEDDALAVKLKLELLVGERWDIC